MHDEFWTPAGVSSVSTGPHNKSGNQLTRRASLISLHLEFFYWLCAYGVRHSNGQSTVVAGMTTVQPIVFNDLLSVCLFSFHPVSFRNLHRCFILGVNAPSSSWEVLVLRLEVRSRTPPFLLWTAVPLLGDYP